MNVTLTTHGAGFKPGRAAARRVQIQRWSGICSWIREHFLTYGSSMGMWEAVGHVLGLSAEPKNLTFVQICLRGVIVFAFSLAMVRLADKRFLAKLSAFDAILGFILASMLARAVNGSAAFFPTLAAGFVLVLFHRGLAKLACHWDWFSKLIKGKAEVLVQDGQKKVPAMNKNNITEADLLEELRLNGQVKSVEEVEVATIERSGEISVVRSKES